MDPLGETMSHEGLQIVLAIIVLGLCGMLAQFLHAWQTEREMEETKQLCLQQHNLEIECAAKWPLKKRHYVACVNSVGAE